MAAIRRGEIRWADLNPTRGDDQAGSRPVLILSQNVFNQRSGIVIAIALASQPPRAGFPRTMRCLGQVSPEELEQILEGLNEILGA